MKIYIKLIGDEEIMKKLLSSVIVATSMVALLGTTGASAAKVYGDSVNYVENTESAQLKYSGYIQFKASHKFDGGYVKRAYINYTRDGESLTGGRVYTSTATTNTDSTIRSASDSVWDSLNPWAPKTLFHYDFLKF